MTYWVCQNFKTLSQTPCTPETTFICIWDLSGYNILFCPFFLFFLAYKGSHSSKILISGNGSIQLFRFEGKKKFVPDKCLKKHSSSASQVHFPKFSPNDMLVSGGDDCRVVLWNLSSGQCNGTSVAENIAKEASSVCVVHEVQHGSKINWISSSSPTQNIFVADLTNDISVYCVTWRLTSIYVNTKNDTLQIENSF